MLDQNITTLLSTLLGGSLAITGSIVANFYVNRTQLKENKRKELQQILERIFKSLTSIDELLKTFPYRKISADDAWNELMHNLNNVIYLHNMYMPNDVFHLYSDYIDALDGIKDSFHRMENNESDIRTYFNEIAKYEVKRDSFADTIKAILKKRGYNYF